MKIKKIVSLFLVLIIALSAISCTVGDTPESSNEESQSITEGTPIETPEETPIETPNDDEENIYDLSCGKIRIFGTQITSYDEIAPTLERFDFLWEHHCKIYVVFQKNSNKNNELLNEVGLSGYYTTLGEEMAFATYTHLETAKLKYLDLDVILRLASREEVKLISITLPEGTPGPA